MVIISGPRIPPTGLFRSPVLRKVVSVAAFKGAYSAISCMQQDFTPLSDLDPSKGGTALPVVSAVRS